MHHQGENDNKSRQVVDHDSTCAAPATNILKRRNQVNGKIDLKSRYYLLYLHQRKLIKFVVNIINTDTKRKRKGKSLSVFQTFRKETIRNRKSLKIWPKDDIRVGMCQNSIFR